MLGLPGERVPTDAGVENTLLIEATPCILDGGASVGSGEKGPSWGWSIGEGNL